MNAVNGNHNIMSDIPGHLESLMWYTPGLLDFGGLADGSSSATRIGILFSLERCRNEQTAWPVITVD